MTVTSSLADVIFFFGEDQIVNIGSFRNHGLTTFPGQYMPDSVSDTSREW